MASISKRNGRYNARVRIKGYPSISKTFNDRRSAQAWALRVEDEIRRGVYNFNRNGIPTLAQALDKYKRVITPKKRGADVELYIIGLLQKLPMASKPLNKIQTVEFTKLRDDWLKELKPSTVRSRLALLSHLYGTAIREWGFNIENPLERVSRPRVNNARDRVICEQELDAILDAVYDPTLKIVAQLAWLTAARLGELAALQWENVDLDARTIHFPITKNNRSRTVPLVPEAVVLLSEHKLKTHLELDAEPTGLVFDATSSRLSQRWRLAVQRSRRLYEQDCKAKGVQPCSSWLVGARFHDLRHSAITRLAGQGLSTLKLAAISGHETLQLLHRYTHIKAEDLAQELAELDT